MKKTLIILVSLTALVFLGAGCTPSASVPGTPANTASGGSEVSIHNFSFNPATITVKRGTAVTWKNNDSTGHTITADGTNGPASGVVDPGTTYSFTFDTAGTFTYHCSIHPSMRGTVIVN